MSETRTWGTTEADRAMPFGCDAHVAEFDEDLFRGIDVDAPPEIAFRWLCQMRVAPYSYDWIDNLGRQSPRRLIDGLDRLARGQTFMTIFELVDFVPGKELTLALKKMKGVFGALA